MAYARNTRRPGRRREEVMQAERQNYGALNAVGGVNRSGRYIYSPWDRCLRPRPPIDPIYRGPCPPNPDGTDLEDVYASFYTEGELTVNEASPTVTTEDGIVFSRIELNAVSLISEEGIVKERTRILVLDPGIYSVSYEFRIPENETAAGTLALLYDRAIIPAMVTEFNKTELGVSASYSAHTLIEVGSDGAELILGTTGSFSLTPAGYEPIATLTLFSIA